jgi:hypothetical protein
MDLTVNARAKLRDLNGAQVLTVVLDVDVTALRAAFAAANHVAEVLPAVRVEVLPPQPLVTPPLTTWKGHRGHAWCDRQGRVKCVPSFIHDEFMLGIGGDGDSRLERVTAFYEQVAARHAGAVVGEDAVAFWRAQFKGAFGGAPVSSGPPTKAGRTANAARELAARYAQDGGQ